MNCDGNCETCLLETWLSTVLHFISKFKIGDKFLCTTMHGFQTNFCVLLCMAEYCFAIRFNRRLFQTNFCVYVWFSSLLLLFGCHVGQLVILHWFFSLPKEDTFHEQYTVQMCSGRMIIKVINLMVSGRIDNSKYNLNSE